LPHAANQLLVAFARIPAYCAYIASFYASHTDYLALYAKLDFQANFETASNFR
jgi:hypothetical protein